MLLFVLLFFGFCFEMDLNALATKRQTFDILKNRTNPCPADVILFSDDEDLDEIFRNQAAKSIEQHLVRGQDAQGSDK